MLPDLKDITKIYVGKPETCMCGCSGIYYYAKEYRELGGKERGYCVDDDEVNDAKIKRVLKKMATSEESVDIIKNYIFTKVIGHRQYTIYTKEPQMEAL